MTDTTFEDTIDWNSYWKEADDVDRERATPSSHHVRALLADFFEAKGVPDSFADVGCGPGVVTFDVARRHPEVAVVGYDAAESVLAENRERAAEEGLGNVRFERAVLPEFDPGRRFEAVLCYGTLSYVADSEPALRALYGAVAPGGHLVLGYTNRLYRAHVRRRLADLRETPPGERDVDPERFARRWSLVLAGESTLSYDRIGDALGTHPRSFWELTERPDERWAWRHVPLVWVPSSGVDPRSTGGAMN